MELRQCCMKTKRGVQCPINADRTRDGKDYCHVHDPEGRFRTQINDRLVRKKTSAHAMALYRFVKHLTQNASWYHSAIELDHDQDGQDLFDEAKTILKQIEGNP